MNRLLQWIKGARWRESFSHCFEGLLIQVPMTLLTTSVLFGAASVVVWYWSRKKLEVEMAAQGANATHVDEWSLGWFPWQWSGYQVLDVVMPAVSSFSIGALLAYFRAPV